MMHFLSLFIEAFCVIQQKNKPLFYVYLKDIEFRTRNMYIYFNETTFIPDINPTSSFSRDINKRCQILQPCMFKVAKLLNICHDCNIT